MGVTSNQSLITLVKRKAFSVRSTSSPEWSMSRVQVVNLMGVRLDLTSITLVKRKVFSVPSTSSLEWSMSRVELAVPMGVTKRVGTEFPDSKQNTAQNTKLLVKSNIRVTCANILKNAEKSPLTATHHLVTVLLTLPRTHSISFLDGV
jgi:hypothetical protein